MVFDRTAVGTGFLAATSLGLALDAFLESAVGSVLFLVGFLAFPVGVLFVWADARVRPDQDMRLVRLGGWASVLYVGILVALLVALTPFNLKNVGVVNPDPSPALEEATNAFVQLLPVVLATGTIAVVYALLRKPLRFALLAAAGILILLGLLDLAFGTALTATAQATFLPPFIYGLVFLAIAIVLVQAVREMRHPPEFSGVATQPARPAP